MAQTEYANINPTDLGVEVNVRTDVQLKTDFVSSIAQHGVLVPVIARRDETGELRVIAGQRRTRAAVEAGLTSIPVRILEGLDTDEARIVAQIIENDQREALTEAERVTAYEQLSAFGLSATQIGKRLNTGRGRVQKGLKVGADATAATALVEHRLTLDQAAVLAEVSDNEEDVARLLDGATRGTFDHEAKRVQDARTERAAIAKTTAELVEQGVTVIDYAQTYSGGGTELLTGLTDQDGQRLTQESHTGCPGHVAAVTYRWHSATTSVVWACSDWKANGHRDRRNNGPSGALSAEDKRNRQEVIANNKAWDSAAQVRREWLRALLARKTAPKDAGQVMARILTSEPYLVAKALGKNNRTAAELLGHETSNEYGAPSPLVDLAAEASPARAQVIALAVVLGAFEASLGRHSWRAPDAEAAAYLNALAGWGYGLADVERIVTDAQQAKG